MLKFCRSETFLLVWVALQRYVPSSARVTFRISRPGLSDLSSNLLPFRCCVTPRQLTVGGGSPVTSHFTTKSLPSGANCLFWF